MAGLNREVLRLAPPLEVVQHLRAASLNGTRSDLMTQQIAIAVEAESMSPHLLSLWITACPDLSATKHGLCQMSSVSARIAAIKRFARIFRKGRHAAVWHAVGGVDGLLSLMSCWSVNEVSVFCRAIGRSSTTGGARTERQELITGLVKALVPALFEEEQSATMDDRPLLSEYVRLVYACTPDVIDCWLERKDLPGLDHTKLVAIDPWLHRDQCLQGLSNGDVDLAKYEPLFTSLPVAITEQDSTISEPTAFTLQVVELMSELKGLNLCQNNNNLPFEILLKRAARSKVSDAFAARSINALACCLRIHKGALSAYRLNYNGVVEDIVRLWRRDPLRFEPDLTQILRFGPQFTRTTEFLPYLTGTSKDLRHQLLRWLTLVSHRTHLDIDDVHSIRKAPLFRISGQLLPLLPRPEALRLLDNVSQARPHGGVLEVCRLGRPSEGGQELDISLSKIQLGDGSDAATTAALGDLKQCQRQAESSRDQPSRAFWAKAALAFAFASRNLAACTDALMWARRYNRDPLTLPILYSRQNVLNNEAVQLIAGSSLAHTDDLTKHRLSAHVADGNKIAMLLLGTATMCQRGPSFNSGSFQDILRLFRHVAFDRLRGVEELQRRLGLDDNSLFDVYLRPTIDVLLEAECVIFDPDNKALQSCITTAGLLGYGRGGETHLWEGRSHQKPSRHALRLLDELAQRRDELWQQIRVSEHPTVSMLKSPWTRGLPIQVLCGAGRSNISSLVYRRGWMPFLDRRAEAVVFTAADAAQQPLPGDDDLQAAIGGFIDDYKVALALYVARTAGQDPDDRQRRISQAWEHALTKLSGARMTDVEAKLYWRSIFQQAGVEEFKVDVPQRACAKLPPSDEQAAILEWNPDPYPKDGVVEPRTLEPVCIDLLTSSPGIGRSLSLGSYFPRHTNEVMPGLSQHGFWQTAYVGKENAQATKDPLIAAAMLFFEGRAAIGSGILSAPHPNAEDVRFPAMYLDAEFLDRKDHSEGVVANALRMRLRDVPASLLRRLASSFLTKLKTKPKNEQFVRRWGFELLKMLAWSDKPQVALEIIAGVVVEMPDESSWHRELLHHGILKRLPAKQAEELVTGLQTRILDRLRAKHGTITTLTTTSDTSAVESEADAPNVKVTTVKMLAQMLNGATLIGEARSVETLIVMFEQATHFDIRVAIVESLMSMLRGTKLASVRDSIVDVLETHAIPLASEINERFPMTEDQWAKATETLEPPETYMESSMRAVPPICNTIVQIHSSPSGDPDGLINVLEARFLVAIIERSMENNQRWMSIFLRKHRIEQLASILPVVPVRPILLLGMLKKHPLHMPRAFFQKLSSYLLLHQDPPQELLDFNDRLLKADKLRNTKEAKQWQGVWGKGALAMHDARIPESLQRTEWPMEAREGLMSLEDVQMHERKMLDTLLAIYDRSPGIFDAYFLRHRQSPRPSNKEHAGRWFRNSRPMIEYLVSRVNTLRSQKWQQDPQRRPAILPETFPMRLWLLSYPTVPTDGNRYSGIDDFAKDIVSIIDHELVPDQRPYHRRLALVEDAVKILTDKTYARLAALIGDIEPADGQRKDIGVTELLRVELASSLLQKATKPDDLGDVDLVKRMLSRWRESQNEDVRRAGLITTKHLESRDNAGDARSLF